MAEDPNEHIRNTIERLYSQDANDRVKAAGELGEIGTPEVAPQLLEVAYEDEASTVRQMAIQSYSEILGEESLEDIIKAADEHFDEYVKIYAVMVLGRIGGKLVGEPLSRHIKNTDNKVKAAALRAMIHAETREYADQVFEILQEADQPLIQRNCIEALALWKFKDGKNYIKSHFFGDDVKDLEIKTISAFYLAVMGDKDGTRYLEEERVDNYIRIAIDDTHYRGKDGLLEAVAKL